MNLFENTQSTSKYDITWNEQRKLWQVQFDFNGKKSKSYFKNELDATKRIFQLCTKMGISPRNPEICDIPSQQDLVTLSFFTRCNLF